MSEKKLTVKRIIIFTLFSCGLFWGFAGLCDLLGILQNEAGFMLTSSLGMLTPAIGSLLTRLVTKEGMANSMLRLNLKGNVKYYILAFLIPMIYSVMEVFLFVAFADAKLDLNAPLEITGISAAEYIMVLFMNIASTITLLPVFMGEELGWRGYLFPKMKTVMNRPAAYIVSGIIWGVWHTPAIIDGLNFGKDYAGYPYIGILLMCVFCIFTGIIFTWLAEKTNSVYPAAIAHGINNNIGGMILVFADFPSEQADTVSVFVLGNAGVIIVALFCIADNIIVSKRKRAEA